MAAEKMHSTFRLGTSNFSDQAMPTQESLMLPMTLTQMLQKFDVPLKMLIDAFGPSGA